MTQHEKLKDLAQMIVNNWGTSFADPDEQISGCDAVESLGNYVDLAQDALATKEPTPSERAKGLRNIVTSDEPYFEGWPEAREEILEAAKLLDVQATQTVADAPAKKPRKAKLKLKHFDTPSEVMDYIASEFVSTLEDDLNRMTNEERRFYSSEDRADMRGKLHDVRIMADLLPGMLETLSTLAGMKTEEEFGEEGMSGDDAVMTLSSMIVQARGAIGLTKKGR